MINCKKSCLLLGSAVILGSESSAVSGHMARYPTSSEKAAGAPIDLGDITENSWAIATEIAAEEVHYYKFNIADLKNGEPENEQFWMGLYVPPGEAEQDFTFFAAFWGLSADTKCTRWADGWGRRLGGEGVHGHDDAGNSLPYSRTKINDESAILVGREAIPSFVKDRTEMDVLIFEASSEMKMPPKFEGFSPTVFQPRASCVAPFPRTGEYIIGIWSAPGTKGTYHYSLGLGLKEADVFAIQNLVTFDYILFPMYMWNHWNPFVVILPILVTLFATLYFLQRLTQNPDKKSPTVFEGIAMSAGSIFVGQAIFNIINLLWCVSIADPHGEATLAVVMGILMPIITGTSCFVTGFKGCCCKENAIARNICARVTLAGVGLFHMFGWHCGYLIAPVGCILASLLPPKLAEYSFDTKMIEDPDTELNQVAAENKKAQNDNLDHGVVLPEQTAEKLDEQKVEAV